jgi:uncharacterized protein YdbL (DUF1318 family)
MKSSILIRLLFLLALFGLGSVVAQAQDLNAIKARMEQRQGTVDALKDRGVVGEDNRGFLDVRGQASGPEQQTVSDENSDRRTVYAELAKQTGTTPDLVGRQRAQQIAIRSKRGVWIQDPSGEWRQKG